MSSRVALAAQEGLLPTDYRPRYLQQHLEQQFPDLRQRTFRDSLFWRCRFEKLTKTTLLRCSLPECSVEPKHLVDLIGLSLTLDCFTFQDLRLNERAFDAVLHLLSLTAGNDEKRQQIRQLINPEYREEFARVFQHMARR